MEKRRHERGDAGVEDEEEGTLHQTHPLPGLQRVQHRSWMKGASRHGTGVQLHGWHAHSVSTCLKLLQSAAWTQTLSSTLHL